ncbi:MAG: 2-iminoacetate synthase ThiH [Verrucomicrobia bacterium]|nr:2-iminoacetate synthase ThiH [Verrucomicrobiota bacterium]
MMFSQFFCSSNRPRSRAIERFASLLLPLEDDELTKLVSESERLTRRFFGKTMRLFAPLYLSNECINSCKYCGFSRDNPILRVTLTVDEVEKEARHLAKLGFRSILLVSGEHPKYVSVAYLEQVIKRLSTFIPSIAIEVAPMEVEDYKPLIVAGAEGVAVYQETYDRAVYAELHTAGPKKDFDWRLDCPERAYAAGFRRIGVATLFGLSDWRSEAVCLAEHIEYLLKKCWRAHISASVPRLRPAAGGFKPRHKFSDRDLLQFLCALRVTFPQIAIVLSTRESAPMRDALMLLGVTIMSAGSRTDPGGYTHQGTDSLHVTVRGKISKAVGEAADGQFEVEDRRPADQVVEALRHCGLEPVWKDWDSSILVR